MRPNDSVSTSKKAHRVAKKAFEAWLREQRTDSEAFGHKYRWRASMLWEKDDRRLPDPAHSLTESRDAQ